MRGGKRAGAGRPPGAQNKRTVEWKELYDELDGSNRDLTRKLIQKMADSATAPACGCDGCDHVPDWRAGDALLNRRFGRPKESAEIELSQTVNMVPELPPVQWSKRYGRDSDSEKAN